MRLPPGGVLTLDLSGTVGWCYGLVGDKLPLALGAWELSNFVQTKTGLIRVGTNGTKGMSFQNELVLNFLCIGKKQETIPSQIIVEKPLPPQATPTTTMTFSLQYGLDFVTEVEACRYSVGFARVDAWTVRREVFGDALRGIHPKKLKSEILRLIRAKGIPAKDHNAADAAAIWLWHKYRITHGAGPLWEAA